MKGAVLVPETRVELEPELYVVCKAKLVRLDQEQWLEH